MVHRLSCFSCTVNFACVCLRALTLARVRDAQMMPAIREGNYELVLRSDLKSWLRDDPLIDWRGLLETSTSHEQVLSAAPPTAYFNLKVVNPVSQDSRTGTSPLLRDATPALTRHQKCYKCFNETLSALGIQEKRAKIAFLSSSLLRAATTGLPYPASKGVFGLGTSRWVKECDSAFFVA